LINIFNINIKGKNKNFWISSIIFLVSGPILLTNLGDQYLWQDEAQTSLISLTILDSGLPYGYDGKNFFSQELGVEYGENYIWKWHTWLPFYIQAGFFELFGVDTFTARLPFALMGILTIWATFFFTRELLSSEKTAWAATALLICSVPFLILMKQARLYSPLALFTILSLWCYLRLLKEEKNAGWLFVVSSTLLFHAHYLYFAILITVLVIHSLIFYRNLFIRFLVPIAISFVINLPWMIWLSNMRFRERYDHDLLDFQRHSIFLGKYISDLMQYIFSPVFLLIPIVLLVANWVRRKKLLSNDKNLWQGLTLLLLFIGINITVLTVVSPAPFFRYMTPIIPLLYIILGLIAISTIRVHLIMTFLVIGTAIYKNPVQEYYYELTHDFNGPMEGIARHLNQYGKGHQIVAINYGDMPIKFYTNMRVIGGLTGENPSPARNADWIIIRRHKTSPLDEKFKEYLKNNVLWENYEQIEINYPDTRFQNRESLDEHHFRTEVNEFPIVIFKKIRG
jgi:4-amino-4-deoxy-L-arabinose transferase-like glycosyltransferase